MKWTVGTKIGIGFGLTLTILVAIGGVTYHSTTKLVEASDWVAHTHRVLEALTEAFQGLTDAETGQRGYLLTQQDAYLAPHKMGSAAAELHLKEVRNLTNDNPNQQRRLDELEPLFRQRLATIQSGIDAATKGGVKAGQEWLTTGKGLQEMNEIRKLVGQMRDEETALLRDRGEESQASAQYARVTIVAGTLIAFVLVFVAALLITRSMSNRLKALTAAAQKVAEGSLAGSDLNVQTRDEIGDLAIAFTTMRNNLREMTSQIRQATENVNATAAEVLAATQQQAAAVKEQAATIQQMTTTMEEITQSGGQISDRAKNVSSTVVASAMPLSAGMKATQDTSQTMEAIRNQVEEVAENVVGLCERTQTIGEIISTVSEIAEQSNLLALNASIEAVSAGEHGGRFGVVAHEMKNLADRAKDCTVQVRTILGEIQKGINTSVMLTEEAVKRADGGKRQAQATEVTIREVTNTNEESLQAFQQIVAGTNQQQIGVTQVTQGMQDIRQAIKQTAASTSQLEKAAANMNALSQQLHLAVERYRV